MSRCVPCTFIRTNESLVNCQGTLDRYNRFYLIHMHGGRKNKTNKQNYQLINNSTLCVKHCIIITIYVFFFTDQLSSSSVIKKANDVSTGGGSSISSLSSSFSVED